MRRFSDDLVKYWYSGSAPGAWAHGISRWVGEWVGARQRKSRNLSQTVLGVPVVVVGNITLGGTGKTPLIAHLVEEFSRLGYKVGIVSRGHGGRGPFPCQVTAETPVSQCGDEPLLLARRCRVPIVVDPDRMAACRKLLALAEPDVIFSDDGLQHYAMPRQVEVVVFDGERGVGNGLLLPFGPLREPVSRLNSVDAIVVNGPPLPPLEGLLREHASTPVFSLALKPGQWRDLRGQLRQGTPGQTRAVVVVAGIGNPERFFTTLSGLGLTFEKRIFPDHHRYRRADLADLGEVDVVTTEKDAVKISPHWLEHVWVLPVRAETRPSLASHVADRLLGDAPRTLEFVE